MIYKIIHPENPKNPAEWWQGNPRVQLDLHYGELTHLVNRIEQLAKSDTSAYPLDAAMLLVRELTLIRDKAALERQAMSSERLAREYQREASESERRANLLEQDAIIAEEDATRLRAVIRQREQRIQTLSGEVARLEAERASGERLDAQRRAFEQAEKDRQETAERVADRAATNGNGNKPKFKKGDKVRVTSGHEQRIGQVGIVDDVRSHFQNPFDVSVKFGETVRCVFRSSELELVEAAEKIRDRETTRRKEEPVVVPV